MLKNIVEMNLVNDKVSKYVSLWIKIQLDKTQARIERYSMLADNVKYDSEKIAEEILYMKLGITKTVEKENKTVIEKDADFINKLGPLSLPSNKVAEKVYKIGAARFSNSKR